MKKAKIFFWLIVFGFIALIIYQNRSFFLATQSLGINLFFKAYQTPEIPNAVLFVAFFLIGVFLTYVFCLFDKFKANKTIKQLRQSVDSYQKTMETMKKDLENIKNERQVAPPEQSTASDQPHSADGNAGNDQSPPSAP